MNRRGSGRSAKRNRVDERTALAIAVVAGMATIPAGAEPTGAPFVDVALTALAVGFITWAGASAPWWAGAGLAGVAAALAVEPIPAVAGVLAFGLGLWIGIRRRDLPEARAVVTGVGLNVALWSGLDEPLGLVAAVTVPLGILVAVTGIRRRRNSVRWIGWALLGGVAALAVVSVGMFVLSALSARASLEDGNALAQGAIDALNAGDYEVAAARFDAAADRLALTDRQLSQVWAQPARLVPVVAQNRRAAADLAEEAARGLRDASDALAQVDPQALRLVDGAFDLGVIAAVEKPLLQVRDALRRLDGTIDAVESIWVAEPVQRELDELAADIAENGERLETALSAVRRAPGFLGADGQRRYLALFTTPSETRGLGGFPGNFAELTVEDGRITMSDFGRISDLERTAIAERATCEGCPPEFVETWGAYGFTNGLDGGVGIGNWRGITAPAHFPYVAEAAQVLYPQSGGRPIDGVLVIDPYVVEQFVEYTGPMEVPELDVSVDEDNVLSFILYGQYLTGEPNAERIDALETIGTQVITALLSSGLPAPPELARDLGPLVEERRLLFWTDDPDEQALLEEVGLLGSLPVLPEESPAGFSVSVANSGGSKIDVFLRRDVELTVVENGDGASRLVADVTLYNDAPAGGLPRYVIGNATGRPEGTSRLLVSFYAPDTPDAATLDGSPTALGFATEAGWTVHRQFVDVPPGSSVAYRLEFQIPPRSDSAAGNPTLDDVVTWEQPIIRRASDRRPHEPSD